MTAYRKERIENALLFFAKEHYKKTHKYLSQTALYKYLAFFEFRQLKEYGKMPLELHYKAMEHGPVPEEIYSERNNPKAFSLVTFESKLSKQGTAVYLIKPAGKSSFAKDYFSENELAEMHSLIEIFAQRWIDASVMSDASHKEIQAWKITYRRQPNAMIDPIDNFERNLSTVPFDELTQEEERFLMHKELSAYISENSVELSHA